MASLSKTFAAFFSILVVLNVFLVGSCVAPVTVPVNPKAGPEIESVTLHNNPIWHSPISSTNLYTGQITSVEAGYWSKNGTIEIAIKNRSFTPYIDEYGNTIRIYYCVFYKYFDPPSEWMGDSKSRDVPLAVYQSGPDCTVITFTYGDNTQLGAFSGDIGFRIQAVEGYFIRDPYVVPTFEGDGSEWTEFTITLPPFNSYEKIQPSGTFKPAIQTTAAVPLTPQNPEQTNILSVLAAVCIITIPISILTYQYGKRKTKLSYFHHYAENIDKFITKVCRFISIFVFNCFMSVF